MNATMVLTARVSCVENAVKKEPEIDATNVKISPHVTHENASTVMRTWSPSEFGFSSVTVLDCGVIDSAVLASNDALLLCIFLLLLMCFLTRQLQPGAFLDAISRPMYNCDRSIQYKVKQTLGRPACVVVALPNVVCLERCKSHQRRPSLLPIFAFSLCAKTSTCGI